MPSNMSTIGFPVSTEDEFLALAEHAAEYADEFKVEGGAYLCYADESGAQLWMQVDNDMELVGLNPHFEAASGFRVGITARVDRSDSTP